MTLWKREDEPPARAEEVALSGAVNMFLEAMRKDERILPSFDSFYEFVDTDYRTALKRKKFRKQDFDIDGFLNILSPYHRGGEYDYLLNNDSRLDLLDKRFIVFEIDAIRDHAILFPIVTIVIMDAFIGKMRRLKGVRKVLFIEEAWKALMKNGMADYVKFLYKTVRKYYGECITITQEIDDLVSSPIVKESIVINSDCKILLDQRKYINKFDGIQSLLGLTDKERDQILSINLDNDPARHYKEVWIGLGGTRSAVYATEVSEEEYLCYTTSETEKMEVMREAERVGGDMELALRRLAECSREKHAPDARK